jgi:hypothetical protein
MVSLSRFARFPAAAAVALAFSLAACDESKPTATTVASTAVGSGPVVCPTNTSQSATGLIDPLLGGTVAVGGTSISLPAGAVTVPTPVTVTLPVSTYMEATITANGLEHILFQLPVTITIDYSRCSRSNVDRASLSAWNVDPTTFNLIENMGGTDDKTARTVTFTTGHLSSYVIAY